MTNEITDYINNNRGDLPKITLEDFYSEGRAPRVRKILENFEKERTEYLNSLSTELRESIELKEKESLNKYKSRMNEAMRNRTFMYLPGLN